MKGLSDDNAVFKQDIEKIIEVSITDNPRSRANGGTRTNAKD